MQRVFGANDSPAHIEAGDEVLIGDDWCVVTDLDIMMYGTEVCINVCFPDGSLGWIPSGWLSRVRDPRNGQEALVW